MIELKVSLIPKAFITKKINVEIKIKRIISLIKHLEVSGVILIQVKIRE